MKQNYGWVIVGAGAVMTGVTMGSMFSLAVFLQPMAEATGWSRGGISSAMTIAFLCMGVAGFGWGALSDRYGPRLVVLIGSVLLGVGVILASRARGLLEFQLVYGGMVGIAAGSMFAPLMGTVTGWFTTHRSLAVSLVSAGMGVAPMTISPLARWLVSTYDWRTAQLTIGILALVLMLPAALLVRRAPAAARMAGPAVDDGPAMTVRQALTSRPFIVLAATYFACCAAHSGPIFHTVSYAIGCGLPVMAAVTIYSVEGLAGLGGRLLLGLLGDRFGAKPVLIGGLLVQALAAGSYLLAGGLGQFYLVAVIFGAAYGGVMPLYSVLARQYFGVRIISTVIGAAGMISSLGMALGPAVGGWIFDQFNGYGWLYIGSLAIGVVAVLTALAFPPLPRRLAA